MDGDRIVYVTVRVGRKDVEVPCICVTERGMSRWDIDTDGLVRAIEDAADREESEQEVDRADVA